MNASPPDRRVNSTNSPCLPTRSGFEIASCTDYPASRFGTVLIDAEEVR